MPCAGRARYTGGPLLASSGSLPPLTCMPCAGSARCSGGAPSSASWFGGPPSLSGWHSVRWKRTLLFGGVSPFLCPRAARGGCARWLRAACLRCPPHPPARTRVARTAWAGGGFLLLVPAAWWGPALPCLGVSRWSLAVSRGCALLVGGFPPSFPSLAAAHIKRAQTFRGSPSLVSGFSHAARGERALQGFVLRLPPVLFPRDPMAGRTPWVSRVGWVDRRPRPRQ